MLPSRYEPFGLVAVESISAGVPLITSGVGGISEIVPDERYAYKYNVGDIDDLKRNLTEVYYNYKNAINKTIFAQEHLRRNYSWQSAVKKLQKVIAGIESK